MSRGCTGPIVVMTDVFLLKPLVGYVNLAQIGALLLCLHVLLS